MTDRPADTTSVLEHTRVRLFRLDERAAVPVRKTELAAGYDVAACLPRGDVEHDALTLEPGARGLVPTGLAIAIPVGHEGQVRPRSGLAIRHGVTVINAPGTIDADYRGELLIGLVNLGDEPFTIRHGDRIAQLVIAPVTCADFAEVDDAAALGETERGAGGFGSTGR